MCKITIPSIKHRKLLYLIVNDVSMESHILKRFLNFYSFQLYQVIMGLSKCVAANLQYVML